MNHRIQVSGQSPAVIRPSLSPHPQLRPSPVRMPEYDTIRCFKSISLEQAARAAMWLRCDGPDCSCHGAHDLPPLKSINLIWRAPCQEQIHQIHEEGTELDVIFDIFSGTMALRQHVRKPQAWHEVDRVTSVYFTQSNITFINLEGLLDNSLLLTFRYHSTKRPSVQDEPQIWQSRIRTCKTRIRRRAHGFLPSALNEGRLVQDIEDGSADEMIMQLRIPDDRAMAWKTVALALLTLRQIDRKTWHLLASIEDSVDIAGFSWEELMLNDQSITGEGCDSPVVNMLDETRESTGSEDRALSYWVESHTSPAQVCLQGTW